MFQPNTHILISEGSSEGRGHYRSLFRQGEHPCQSFETELFPDTLSLLGFFYAQYRVGKRIPLSLLDIGPNFGDGCRTAEALLKTDPETMIIIISDIPDLRPAQQKCLLPHIYFFRKPAPSEALYSLVSALLRNWNERLSLRKEPHNIPVNREKIIFDEKGVAERMGSNQNLIRMMIKIFIANIPKQLAEIKEKLKQGKAEEVTRMGHTIKGSSATAGAVSMQNIAFEIETAGKRGNLADAARLTGELETAFEEMKKTVAEKGLI
ncbi:MAG: Hpt domain-containing protein [Desulfococcaceae bacterium]